uniref:Uncharacterized protein n=1 Tax=Chromera velia CCMP2878 TaxID=1169474 RepID=A0A0G4HU71_9ALVE|eukprot:Cvel_8589.t1-p1 / transcript=Cvel_8589.t1 / gene=Cvel_8589 / organism=Chromera_velia_CCMP2878 / gene_product=hypothetical protein / transcript_product=hypothetical protein / location=Cvel_scaffold476:77697-78041(-) / protein_length=115 / sequence_SO=supercontig / SO=protein_coding / is_pseudo=false
MEPPTGPRPPRQHHNPPDPPEDPSGPARGFTNLDPQDYPKVPQRSWTGTNTCCVPLGEPSNDRRERGLVTYLKRIFDKMAELAGIRPLRRQNPGSRRGGHTAAGGTHSLVYEMNT